MRIVVVGGGKMGLPLAAWMAEKGGEVVVCDINASLVEKINRGECPFEETRLEEYLPKSVRAGRLRATTETARAVSEAGVVVVIVPALLTESKDIDYGNLKAASAEIARGLKRGTLVCYETTLPVGGCRTELVPLLEKGSGLKAGPDFQVCFSPERVKSMLVFDRLEKTPKVVGGVDPASCERGCRFYSRYLGAEVINVGSLEAAELVKLAGMLYRDVNIALANELAEMSERLGLPFEPIRQAANTDGEAALLIPGIGVGGHCTPVYPHFLIRQADRLKVRLAIPRAAREINDRQPERALERIEEKLGSLRGKTVHVLGLAFRPNVRETAFSPAFLLREAAARKGARLTLEDPLYSADELRRYGFEPASVPVSEPVAVILNTAHREFLKPDFASWKKAGARLVYDGRGAWNRAGAESVGLTYLSVGG